MVVLRTALHLLRVRARLFLALVFGLLATILLPGGWDVVTRLLVGWNLGIMLYFGFMMHLMVGGLHESIRVRAKQQDVGQGLILILAILASIACMGTIIMELGVAKAAIGSAKAWHTGLAAMTLITAWTFIHLMFATHYAHEYYLPHRNIGLQDRAGLIFPDTTQPCYTDFLYFSFIIGTSAQTADVSVSSPAMRRLSLFHAVIAFFFNTSVLALTINLAAGLL
jgi:uncharacterized membrane protein